MQILRQLPFYMKRLSLFANMYIMIIIYASKENKKGTVNSYAQIGLQTLAK